MMRLFPRQRLRLALFLCPTLRAFNGLEAARALNLPCDWLQFGAKGAAGQAKATAKQQPLSQEARILRKTNGDLRVRGNRYWSEWMSRHAGEKVIAHFNPEDIHADVLIYSVAGQFMGPAKHCEKPVFFDQFAARATRVAPVGSAVLASGPDEFSEPKPWEGIRDQVGAKVWLLTAPEAELRAMALHLLEDRPLTQSEAAVRQLVVLAVSASEETSRRVIGAMQPAPAEKFRLSSRAPNEGGHA